MSRVLDIAFDHPLELEEKASMSLAGGIMQHGYQCGMIWGSTLAAGAQAYRLYGPGAQSETRAILAAERLVESFRSANEHINCLEIIELDNTASALKMMVYFLLKGGMIGCMRRVAKYAPMAFAEINSCLSEDDIEVPSSPVSCASVLAQKLGISEMHTVMAAGFAGGIGLCGGGCGVLGAAIWINGMNTARKSDGKLVYNDPKAQDMVDKFIKTTDCKFECSDIVGRKFDSVADHAAYLHEGGCSNIIEVMADTIR